MKRFLRSRSFVQAIVGGLSIGLGVRLDRHEHLIAGLVLSFIGYALILELAHRAYKFQRISPGLDRFDRAYRTQEDQ